MFMGFLADETESTFVWLLSCFKEFYCLAPAMVALYQQAACMQACANAFPSTYITPDDWHLNKNKLKNV